MIAALRVLILQLRPEDATSDSVYGCFLKYGVLRAEDTRRIRIERLGIPDNLDLDDYSAIIVGGSPFDIGTPANNKSQIQQKIEAEFNKLLNKVVTRDTPPFLAPAPATVYWAITSARVSPQSTAKP